MSEPRRIGKYEIQALLGTGSAASVYRGTDGQKLVALKCMNREAVAEPALARLRQAVTALARARHPAIANFIELIESDKVLCIVSEFAEGETLAARLKESVRPDLRQTWEIARQLLEALEAAHPRGVFHGDLTPANLFLDKHGRIKLTDFATCGLVSGAEGTAAYMAPEQFGDGEITARTDLYQVGAIVYHLVTGKLPFTGTREEIVHRVLQERPSDPSSFTPKIAWQLDWVIQRALSKDPAVRFGSAREFLDGLRLGLQDSIGTPLPVLAAPPAHAPALTPAAPAAPKPAPAAAPARAAPAETAPLTIKPEPAPAIAKPEPITEPTETRLVEKAKLIPPPAPANEEAAGESGKIRVLFVDDDERVLNALRALFRQQYQVFTTDNGAHALEIVQRSGIQIIVSDQRMPGMTGVELLREARKAAPHTVRMLLSGYSDLAALVGSINEGEVFRFVKKPWDNDEIRAMLSDAAGVASKLASRAALRAETPKSAGSVMVIDSQQGLAKVLERLLAGSAPVLLAAHAVEGAKLIQQHDVAVVVADLDAGKDGLLKLFKILKEKRPEILTILLAGHPDSEVVADLINQAQIHRFLPKPVNTRELLTHLGEALRRYAVFKQSSKDSGLAQSVGALPERLVSRTA